jgi:hypothetical protein
VTYSFFSGQTVRPDESFIGDFEAENCLCRHRLVAAGGVQAIADQVMHTLPAHVGKVHGWTTFGNPFGHCVLAAVIDRRQVLPGQKVPPPAGSDLLGRIITAESISATEANGSMMENRPLMSIFCPTRREIRGWLVARVSHLLSRAGCVGIFPSFAQEAASSAGLLVVRKVVHRRCLFPDARVSRLPGDVHVGATVRRLGARLNRSTGGMFRNPDSVSYQPYERQHLSPLVSRGGEPNDQEILFSHRRR